MKTVKVLLQLISVQIMVAKPLVITNACARNPQGGMREE